METPVLLEVLLGIGVGVITHPRVYAKLTGYPPIPAKARPVRRPRRR